MTKEPKMLYYYSLKPMLYGDFLSCYLMSFYVLGPHPGHSDFSCHVSLGSSDWDSFQASLVFGDLGSLRSSGQIIERM